MPYFATTSGVSIHYETAGKGQPLVFIHGWGMSGDVWQLQRGLAESYRLIFPDLRGHGLSESPEDGYLLDDFANDLVEMFVAFSLEKAILIGWSMGVLIALQAFPLLRSRLSALVFLSGTARFTSSGEYSHGLPVDDVRGLSLLVRRNYEDALDGFYNGMFVEGEQLTQNGEQMMTIFKTILPARQAALKALNSLASSDLRGTLPSIDLPVLLVHGGEDRICPPAASRFMAEKLLHARLEIFDGVGHAPFISRPAVFASVLSNFLEGLNSYD